MTKEEYQSKTDIKSVEEARSILSHLQIIFWVAFIWMVALRVGAEIIPYGIYLIVWLGYLSFIIYFIVYCVKIVRLTRAVTKADAVWSIIFAPISWLWFYPELTAPLKIIIGDREPPEKLPERKFDAAKNAASWRKFWRNIIIFTVILLGALGLTIAYVVYETKQTPKTNDQTNVSVIKKNQTNVLGYRFISPDFGFKVNFPSQPSREEETQESEVGEIKTTKYISSNADGATYFVLVANFANEKMNSEYQDFSVDGALEGALNGMLNSSENSILLYSSKTTFFGLKALKYKMELGEETIEGLVFYRGQRQYNLMVDSFTAKQQPNANTFINSFELTD